jgi:hypothetical protein
MGVRRWLWPGYASYFGVDWDLASHVVDCWVMTKVSGGVTLRFVAGCFVGGTILLVFVLFFVINNWEWISTTPGAWISSQAPLEEITRRYRQEIQLYHPDRVVGLAPEIVSVAERHTKEINAAYAEAKRLRR